VSTQQQAITCFKKKMEEYVQQQYENFRIPVPSHNDSLLSLLGTRDGFDLSKRGTLSAQELGEDIAAYVKNGCGELTCVFYGYHKFMTPLLYAEAEIFVAEIKRVVQRYDYDVELIIILEEDYDARDPAMLGDRFILTCETHTL